MKALPTTLEAACAPYGRLAIAGTAKNAGKTTALNHLVARFHAAGERLALSSVGRDGEAIDQLTNRPKPRIRPPVGTLVATSHESALYSQATLERVETTPFRTSLGPVGIYRVTGPGYVEVAGPVRVREAAALLERLEQLGATRLLLDGAADRRAFITAGVDGFVLATGSVLGADPEAVAAQTAGVLARLQLEAPPPGWAGGCEAAPGAGALAASGWTPWPHESFLAGLQGFGAWFPKAAEALWVPGALTDGLAQALLELDRPIDVVLPAGTHLLADQVLLERLWGRGYRFFALRPVRAIALTVNPAAPDGGSADPEALLAVMRRAFPTLPVLDVCRVESAV